MRKRIINPTLDGAASNQTWLDLENTASVELRSEDNAFPIESALSQKGKQGWRAAEPGVQTIRLMFDQPRSLRHISLVFVKTEIQRSNAHRTSR